MTITPETNSVEVSGPRQTTKHISWIHLKKRDSSLQSPPVILHTWMTDTRWLMSYSQTEPDCVFFSFPLRLRICITSVWQIHKSVAPSSVMAMAMPLQWQAMIWVRLSATSSHRNLTSLWLSVFIGLFGIWNSFLEVFWYLFVHLQACIHKKLVNCVKCIFKNHFSK